MGSWLADHIIEGVLKWFASLVVGTLDTLWGLLSTTIFQSPDVTVLPQVTTFASTSLGVVNAVYVLAFLWAGILVMGRDTIQSKVGPSELIPRLVIGLIAANFAVPICSTVINLANAITTALTSQSITAPGSMQHLHDVTLGALNGQTGVSAGSFLLILIGLIIAVLVAILLVQWIIRLGVLIVVVGISPIALALHGLPQTEAAAKLWWRTLLGTLGTVAIQAVALHETLTIFLSPTANLPALGIPGDPGTVMNLLIVVCMLFGVLKVPGLMRRYITKSSPSQVGTILRVVLIQQVTRGLFRGKGTRAVAGAASRTPRPTPTPGGWPVK